MHRLFRFFVFCFCFFCLIFPIFADETNDPLLNVLDYGVSDNGGNYLFSGSAGTFTSTYLLPRRTTVSYVDLVIDVAAGPVPDIRIGCATYLSPTLTRVHLGNNMYRFFGNIQYQSYDQLTLQWTVSGASYFSLLKFDILTARSNYFAETGLMVVGDSPSYTMSSTSDIVTHYWGTGVYGSTVVHFSCPDWKLYDYVTFFVYGYEFNVNSVSARFGSFPLDCSVSYLDSANSTSSYSRWGTMVTVDLTGLNRTKTDVPQIEVTGSFGNSEYQSYIGLISVTGFVSTNEFDSYNYWLRNISAAINSGFDDLAFRQAAFQQDLQTWQQQHHQVISGYLQGISNALVSMIKTLQVSIDTAGINIVDKLTVFQTSVVTWFDTVSDQLDQLIHSDTSESEQFQDDIGSQATEMEDISETLDSVTKPPVDEFDVSIDEYFTGQDTTAFASPLSAFFDNSIFIVMFLMSMIAVTVSYVFYGKR